MKELLRILVVAACPLSMLAMGAAAWLSAKLVPGRNTTASQPAGGRQPAGRG